MLQLLTGRIDQQNAEHLVIDEPPHQFGNPAEQFIQIQNRGQLTRDFVQQQQNARLLGGTGIKLRIFDARRHARSHQREQALMLFGEVARLASLDINYADDAVFCNQRNCEFRAHIGNGFDVAWVLPNIVDQHGLP